MIQISIVVLAYNVEKYIRRCINSILKQNCEVIELIVINDGSIDKTRDIIEGFSKTNKVKIVNKENSGVNSCRKLGLDLAKGNYILFVDADDWIEENSIEVLKKISSDKSDVIIFNSKIAFDNGYGKVLKGYIGDGQDYVKDIMIDKLKPTFWCKLYKVEFLRKNKINFYNLSYAEDLSTNIDILLLNPKVKVVEDIIYNYYQRQGSLTKGSIKSCKDIMESIDNIYFSLNRSNSYEKYRSEYEYLIYYHLFYNILLRRDEWDTNIYEMYSFFKGKNINILKNHYIRKHIFSKRFPLVIKIILFNKDSKSGIFYENIRRKILNRKN